VSPSLSDSTDITRACLPREQELRAALTLAQEDVTIGVIILCGQGPNAFCTGSCFMEFMLS
jgi:1,4-dihydroxy-2-naphthoyl-CoA synthase